MLRIIIAVLTNLEEKYITVELIGRVEQCCVRYKITIADRKDGIDVKTTANNVANRMSTEPGYEVEPPTDEASGSAGTIAASVALLAFLLFAQFF